MRPEEIRQMELRTGDRRDEGEMRQEIMISIKIRRNIRIRHETK